VVSEKYENSGIRGNGGNGGNGINVEHKQISKKLREEGSGRREEGRGRDEGGGRIKLIFPSPKMLSA
jgi:hypothetical protein